MRLTHLGHAGLLVDTAGTRILFDPGVFSPQAGEVRDLDAVIYTHAHPDHLDEGILRALVTGNPGLRVIAEPETADTLVGVVDAERLGAGETATVGGLRLAGIGGMHAVIHPDIPTIGNVGMVLTAGGEPTLFHPGDAYAAVPTGIDVLALPLAGPWCALADTVDFARAVGAPVVVPIHDGTLSPPGRGMFLARLAELTPETVVVRDLAGAGETEL